MAGGSGEIRTHGGRKTPAVFKTAAFNRSATLPLDECTYFNPVAWPLSKCLPKTGFAGHLKSPCRARWGPLARNLG